MTDKRHCWVRREASEFAHFVAGHIPHPNKKFKHVSMGLFFILLGSYMATHPIHIFPDFLWDGGAYSLHGFGAAPIIRIIADFFSIEI